MSNKAREEAANDVVKLFHKTVTQIKDQAPKSPVDMTVDLEVRFKGLLISEKGSHLVFWRDREKKESNIELNLAARVYIPQNKGG